MDDLLEFNLPVNFKTIIKVIGVGGGGSNAVNFMYDKGITGVDFIVANTDVQALAKSPVRKKVQLGKTLTEGLGAGNQPDKGREAAIENIEDIKAILSEGTKMVFITAGMGGGTGTGAAPVIAEAAKEMGILTVGIVTLPFRYEGRKRIKSAVEGITLMEKHVDALLIINNEKIREIYGDLAGSKALGKADEVLTVAAKGIAEIITVEGHINVDFADVDTVMKSSGVALMGTGEGVGNNRAEIAVKAALTSPLLDNTDIKGAKNILLNIVSGENEATMDEISYINEYVQREAGNSADLIWGNNVNEALGEKIAVTIIATGFGTRDIPEIYINNAAEEEEKPTDKKIIIIGDTPVKPKESEFIQSNEYDSEIKVKSTSEHTENMNTEIFVQNIPNEEDHEKKIERHVQSSVEISSEKQKIADYLSNIDELEDVPAYKRKGLNIKEEKDTEKTDFSRETLTDENGEISIKENNSYLHDKAD
ncbi:MAG: cell division protein FtsZ [Bacteroidetes bacterium]|nr:MAG: cell division protein FtsZ [Bacteroidota bacterium]